MCFRCEYSGLFCPDIGDVAPALLHLHIAHAAARLIVPHPAHATFVLKKDKKPGDITGDGFLNGAWHIAQP